MGEILDLASAPFRFRLCSQLIEADASITNQGAPARVVLLNEGPEFFR
jgi:hypothetical protein